MPEVEVFPEGTRPTDATLDAVKEMLRRAWLTLLSIENTSRGPAPPRTAWPSFPREGYDPNSAYATGPPAVRSHTITPQDRTNYLEILGWFASYMNPSLDPNAAAIAERVETVKVFKGWVIGAPIWQLQQRMTTNRRQPASKSLVYKRIDHMVNWIAVAFMPQVIELLKTFQVDRVNEVDQRLSPSTHAAPVLESDLRDLPTSPRYYRTPDAKPPAYDHPDAVAARVRDIADAKLRQRAYRRQKHAHGKKAASKGGGSASGPAGSGRSTGRPRLANREPAA